MRVFRLGTRGSSLALWQASFIRKQLEDLGVSVETVPIESRGDRERSGPIVRLGAQGVFTKEIQRELLDGRIDLAVHSMKDLPTDPVEGLSLAAVPERGDTRDVWISSRYPTLETIVAGARLGTGSLRRQTQLIHLLKTLGEQDRTKEDLWQRVTISDIRGNVETRLRKESSGEYDALVLAAAGLERLGFSERITCYLDGPGFLPAVGQGALAVEVRSSDEETLQLVQRLNDFRTCLETTAERALLKRLEGGCIAPIAAQSNWSGDGQTLSLHGRILSLDGTLQYDAIETLAFSFETLELSRARLLGQRTADNLLEQGAASIISELNQKRSNL